MDIKSLWVTKVPPVVTGRTLGADCYSHVAEVTSDGKRLIRNMANVLRVYDNEGCRASLRKGSRTV
jgi:hypothetical protein